MAGGCGAAESPSTPRGWSEHRDPQGFTVPLPPDWSAASDTRTGRITIRGPADEEVAIWPVFIPGPLDASAAGAVLGRLAERVQPGSRWEAPEQAGPSAVRAIGRAGSQAAVAIFSWAASPRGSGGCLYIARAADGPFRQSEEIFSSIMAGFRVTGPPSDGTPAKKAAVQYVRWTDPREQAFSVEVPARWKVQGGLFRFASVDVRGAIELVSPDGEVRITAGDAELPSFTEPSSMLMMTGFQEGSWYSPGYGVNMMVRRYLPGLAFAREYAESRVARGCTDVRIGESRERPDAVQAVNEVNARFGVYGIAQQLTAGEVFFTARMGGRPVEGYCFAGTQQTQMSGMGLWKVEHLFTALAAVEKKDLARDVLVHLIESYQLNPQWVAMQQGITANTSKIVSQTHEEISGIIQGTYENRQRSDDEISRRRSNAMLEVEDVVDPVTGRELKIESGSDYYWIDHRGTIVGTDTHTLPGLDFREMIRLP
ncbi:MAG TPA: hypothetical protein P5567_06210 [Kiritimatiellia bacterium]|nr:hypothetical protein [Kiritimatiellia bacterium]HRZ12031.1 hypothetical protein [Kiritimatiellia bacterium]HSA17163.1 hypothetical protein [Kiritimatiellia bacterium]